MLCYDIKIRYEKKKKTLKSDEEKEEKTELEFEEQIQKLNAGVYAMTAYDDFYAFVYRVDDDCLDFAVAVWPDKISLSKLSKKLTWAVSSIFKTVEAKVIASSEITTKKYTMLLEEADNRDYLKYSTRKSYRDLKLDYFDNSFFKINEETVEDAKISKNEAIREADAIMADQSFLDEIARIYAVENSRKFYGFPVHYRIQAGSREAAMPIIRLMIRMLHSRNRILGTRINMITEVEENCYDEDDLLNAINQAKGSAVVIELRGSAGEHGNYASSYEAVVRYISGLVERFHQDTLFFFLEDVTAPGFTKEMIANVKNSVDVLDIQEGAGSKDQANAYFKRLIDESPYAGLTDDSLQDYLPKQRVYKCADVHKAFNRWSREVLRNKAYSAYKECKSIEQVSKKKKTTAYEELQQMVGLTEVKRITDQLIASYKMQSLREKYQFDECSVSKHMIFTGNPGSAKTSVARLIADILTDEGVLKSGSFVECGRADLVGRYVGWTAKEVRTKFNQAEGGILFIDEAYSLVDDSRSYGDEAINTIVQEMENRRNNVIVIFAGYPDKMQDFLNRNEGLRSRIAFHLDFPDYDAHELLQIMEIMLKAWGLKTDDCAKEKCLQLFSKACNEEDFGNGRFVRNLIEQAMFRQAQRLMKKYRKDKVPKSSIQRLIASDFDVNIAEVFDKKKQSAIGFCI